MSLPLLMSKNLKLKKVNKSFIPEPISCISGFPMYISRIHILVDLVDPLCITLLIDTYSYTCLHICVGGYVDLRLSLI